MTASTDQGKSVTPAPRRPRSKHAGWKSGLMVAGFGAVVVGAGYLAGTNAPAAGATAQTGSAQATGNQPAVIQQQQAASQDNTALGAQAFGGQALRGDDESEGFSFDDRSNSGSSGNLNNNRGSAQQLQPRQFRRFRGNASGLGQFGTQQQPQFSAPMTRSRGS